MHFFRHVEKRDTPPCLRFCHVEEQRDVGILAVCVFIHPTLDCKRLSMTVVVCTKNHLQGTYLSAYGFMVRICYRPAVSRCMDNQRPF